MAFTRVLSIKPSSTKPKALTMYLYQEQYYQTLTDLIEELER